VTVEWTRRAIEHLREAYEYVARDSPEAAAKIVERVFTVVEGLERYPNMGRQGRQRGSRELVIAGTPFVVVYRPERKTVQILAVFQSRAYTHATETGRIESPPSSIQH
jgi:toxin ParE1/3/4